MLHREPQQRADGAGREPLGREHLTHIDGGGGAAAAAGKAIFSEKPIGGTPAQTVEAYNIAKKRFDDFMKKKPKVEKEEELKPI